jgi:hypothetical protein
MRNGAMLALDRADELEHELRAELATHPRHEERQGRLAELLVARGRSTELDLYVREMERGQTGAESVRRSERLRALALEAGGRVEELSRSRFTPGDVQLTRWQILALAELGQSKEIERRLQKETRIVDMWYDAAVIAVALDLAGDAKSATKWRELALERLMPWGPEAKVAAIVRGEHAATAAEIEALALGSHETSVLLIAAAHAARGREGQVDATSSASSGAGRVAELLDAAARFHPWPGHVQRLIGRLRAAS